MFVKASSAQADFLNCPRYKAWWKNPKLPLLGVLPCQASWASLNLGVASSELQASEEGGRDVVPDQSWVGGPRAHGPAADTTLSEPA